MSFMASKDFNKMQKPLRYINVNSVQTKMWMTECITMDYYNNVKGSWQTCVWSNRCGCAALTLKTCTYTGGNKSKVKIQNGSIISNLSKFVDNMACNSYCQYATHAGCRTWRRKCVKHIPQAECRPQTVCFSQHHSRPHSHSHTVIPWYICAICRWQRQLLNARWNTTGCCAYNYDMHYYINNEPCISAMHTKQLEISRTVLTTTNSLVDILLLIFSLSFIIFSAMSCKKKIATSSTSVSQKNVFCVGRKCQSCRLQPTKLHI